MVGKKNKTWFFNRYILDFKDMQLLLDNIEGSGELYLKIMKAICGNTEDLSMVDLGCYHAPYTPHLGFKNRTYVDVQDRPLDNWGEQKYFVKSDMIKYLQKGEYFDVSISSDSLEHLSVKEGRLLISLMERYSGKQIIFTPLGDYMISTDKHPDRHRSGWTPEYFKGWASIVIPQFHPPMNLGAFFTWHCDDIKEDFKRVKRQLL